MICELKNNVRILEQDVLELLSLIELCNSFGFRFPQNYTPLPYYGLHPCCETVQEVYEMDAELLAFSFESLLRIIPVIESCQNIVQYKFSSVTKGSNGNPYNKAFLGTFNNQDYFADYYTLNYFHGENMEKIKKLIMFFREGKFQIDWIANMLIEKKPPF